MQTSRPSAPRLDPRQPLVLDTHELGRRPGSMRRLSTTVQAPPDLGTPVIRVPQGSDVDLALRLESVVEGVLVSGTAHLRTEGECGRCLEPVSGELSVDLQELYAYPEAATRARHAGAAEGIDDEELRLIDDLLDVEPALRDAVVLALPMTPLCDQDCRGLCPGCGERRGDLPADHSHDSVDPRWAALVGLQTDAATTPNDDPSTEPPEHRAPRTPCPRKPCPSPS